MLTAYSVAASSARAASRAAPRAPATSSAAEDWATVGWGGWRVGRQRRRQRAKKGLEVEDWVAAGLAAAGLQQAAAKQVALSETGFSRATTGLSFAHIGVWPLATQRRAS
jgi:hypothetical protein